MTHSARFAIAGLLVIWVFATIYPNFTHKPHPLAEAGSLLIWACWPLGATVFLLNKRRKKILNGDSSRQAFSRQFLLGSFWAQCAILLMVNIVASQVTFFGEGMGASGMIWVFLPLALIKLGAVGGVVWAASVCSVRWFVSR